MDGRRQRARTLDDWIFNPTAEDLVCVNRFHDIVRSVYSGFLTFSPLILPIPVTYPCLIAD